MADHTITIGEDGGAESCARWGNSPPHGAVGRPRGTAATSGSRRSAGQRHPYHRAGRRRQQGADADRRCSRDGADGYRAGDRAAALRPHPRAAPLRRITQPAGAAPVGDPLAEADDRVILRCAGGLFGAVGRLVRVQSAPIFDDGPQEVLALRHTIVFDEFIDLADARG